MKENKNLDISLVIPLYTYEKIKENKNLYKINNFKSDIIFLPWNGGSYFKLRKVLKEFVEEKGPDNIFHFILTFPIFLNFFNNYKTIYTYPSTSFKQLNIKGLISTFLAFFESTKLDFLDPQLTKQIQNIFFWKKKDISNTPGSFVDTKYYKAEDVKNKKNWLTFLGRFEDVKQIIPFLKSIPTIDKVLKNNGIVDHEFFILGYGSLEDKMSSYIKNNKNFENIKLHIYFEKEPLNILRYSKVFYSLQKHTNYPSKSLLESLATGNIPIVTDNRDTKKIAHPSFSYYVNESFSAEEIALKTLEIMILDKKNFSMKTKKSSEHIEKYFSICSSVKYYLNIYNDIKKGNKDD